jgi:uncharacterized protein
MGKFTNGNDRVIGDPMMAGMLAATMLITGAVAGVLAGLLGVGGGIVIVPVLYHVFSRFGGELGVAPEALMHVAVGTSLATIIPTSLVSARKHHGKGAVDAELLKSWGPGILIGVLAGTLIAGMVQGAVLTAVFASVALLVAINMARPSGTAVLSDQLPQGFVRHVIATIVGGFSAMMGIGGGTLSVPILSAFSYPIRRAVGTAAAIGILISLPATVGFVIEGQNVAGRPPFSVGYINLVGVALIAPMTMLMAPVGVKIAHSISTTRLRQAFALFLFLTSLRMFFGLA